MISPKPIASDPVAADPWRDERGLIEGIRAGDVRAFEHVFLTHYASLCDFVASYVRSDEAAEEVVADLFRKLWEQRDRWNPTKSIATYLYGAARNRAIDHLRHQRIHRRTAELFFGRRAPGTGAPPPAADADVIASELDAAIDQMVASLPERCRAAFVLRRKHHMSYAEIAELMGTTVKTVEVQIGLALKALRKGLKDWLE